MNLGLGLRLGLGLGLGLVSWVVNFCTSVAVILGVWCAKMGIALFGWKSLHTYNQKYSFPLRSDEAPKQTHRPHQPYIIYIFLVFDVPNANDIH